MTTKNFAVTMTKQFPAWDERQGITVDVQARTKAEAIKYARREMADAGHTGSGCGRAYFKAVESPYFETIEVRVG